MLKKTISYQDYNGTNRTEDFYFNLSKAELVEMEGSTSGGLTNMIEKLISTIDIPEIVKLFKELIMKSYGEKSPDGRRFIKSKDLSEAFSQTEAYSSLFMELATDANAASDFMNGILPIQDDAVTKAKIKQALEEKGLSGSLS